MSNDEQYKLLNKENTINDYFDRWLSDFEIANPTSDFFSDPANCDEDLSCNILSKLEFLFRTLEIFGLPEGYVDGGGHHSNWEQQKAAAAGGRNKKKKGGGPAKKGKLAKLQAELAAQKEAMNKKPTHFDLEPFKKALKSFIALNAESRSHLRTQFVQNQELLINCFKDEREENSFKRCIDIKEIA